MLGIGRIEFSDIEFNITCLIIRKPIGKSLWEGALDIELPSKHTATPLGLG